MGSMTIWHWLIALGVVILVFRTRFPGAAGSDIESAVLQLKKVLHSPKPLNLPAWLKIVVGSMVLAGLLMIAEKVIAR